MDSFPNAHNAGIELLKFYSDLESRVWTWCQKVIVEVDEELMFRIQTAW